MSAVMSALRTALRLGDAPLVTAAGAGGKSSLLFALAREYPAALLTTTTHLGAWQLPWADRVHFVEDPQTLPALLDSLLPGITLLLSAPPGEDGRARGVSAETLEILLSLRARRPLPLFIEADGARQRPLKAPAPHEPNLPLPLPSPFGRGAGGEGDLPLPPPSPFGRGAGGEGRVHLVFAGLSALGQPLDAAHVHRAEIFARLSGLAPGAPVTVEALAAVLTHPEGGLKRTPPGARRVAVLTQAVTPEQQAAGQRLAERLSGAYHAVPLLETHPAPEGILQTPRLLAVWEPVGAVILAAGAGERIGQPKALLSWRGKPFVRHAAERALQAGLQPVIVVGGAQAQAVAAALEGLAVQFVENHAWAQGQGTSVAAGAAALPPESGAAIFLQVDQPHVPVTLLRALRQEHARTRSAIIAPFVDGQRATPVLFDRDTFPELRQLRGARGGRVLFSRHRLHYLPWHDRSILLDVDTPEDYRQLMMDDGRR
ncbi:MAG: molybdenum cofactor cytidylyltransferase [Anaerolineales bacterium]